MKLTVLGCYGPFPKAGGACSGYLLEDGNTKILLDCGNGIISRVQQYCDINSLSAIILTHLHPDHMSDILILRYAVDALQRQGLMNKSLALYSPTSPKEVFKNLAYKNSFELFEINQNLILNINGIIISFSPMFHPYENFAICMEKQNKKFVYSGDTTMNDNIIPFSKDADLLICDSALLDSQKTASSFHLSAKEVGLIAQKANVKNLLLTHFWFKQDINSYINEARQYYTNPNLQAAEEFKTYNI